jgi:hypothetical protein
MCIADLDGQHEAATVTVTLLQRQIGRKLALLRPWRQLSGAKNHWRVADAIAVGNPGDLD